MTRARHLARLFVLACVAGLLDAGCSAKEPKPEVAAESADRERVGHEAAIDAGAARELGIGSRNDVLFDEGFSIVSYDPPSSYKNHAFRWMGQRGHVRLHAPGHRPRLLKLVGWVDEHVIRTKPVLVLYLNGHRLFDMPPIEEHGHWHLETLVPAELMPKAGWYDLLITLNAVAFHWADPPKLSVAVLNDLQWTEPQP